MPAKKRKKRVWVPLDEVVAYLRQEATLLRVERDSCIKEGFYHYAADHESSAIQAEVAAEILEEEYKQNLTHKEL